MMTIPAPLHTLFASARGAAIMLPPRLSRLYGTFHLRAPRSGQHVFGNFVSTLDGVVSLGSRGHAGGGDISGFSAQDRIVMGLLRAVADVVIVGSGTLAADPGHVWTPESIYPALKSEYRWLRRTLGKREAAMNVVVSATGNINLRLPVFASGLVPALILTTPAGAKRLGKRRPPDSVAIRTIRRGGGGITPGAILDEVTRMSSGHRVLVEGGPRLLGSFYKQRMLDEQFLTLSPQIAGRDAGDRRLGLVMGTTFAPRDPLWGTLVDARRGGSLLFLRYSFRRPSRERRR